MYNCILFKNEPNFRACHSFATGITLLSTYSYSGKKPIILGTSFVHYFTLGDKQMTKRKAEPFELYHDNCFYLMIIRAFCEILSHFSATNVGP